MIIEIALIFLIVAVAAVMASGFIWLWVMYVTLRVENEQLRAELAALKAAPDYLKGESE